MSQLDESPDTGVKSEKNVERPSSIIIGYEVQIPKKQEVNLIFMVRTVLKYVPIVVTFGKTIIYSVGMNEKGNAYI